MNVKEVIEALEEGRPGDRVLVTRSCDLGCCDGTWELEAVRAPCGHGPGDDSRTLLLVTGPPVDHPRLMKLKCGCTLEVPFRPEPGSRYRCGCGKRTVEFYDPPGNGVCRPKVAEED